MMTCETQNGHDIRGIYKCMENFVHNCNYSLQVAVLKQDAGVICDQCKSSIRKFCKICRF